MKQLLHTLPFCLIFTLSGCATLFGDNEKTVQIHSQPENAQVFANNMPVGTTPLLMTIPSTWSPTTVIVKKPGYSEQYAQVNTSFQSVGLLNIFWWPGFIVDAITGDMKKVTPESRTIITNLSRAT